MPLHPDFKPATWHGTTNTDGKVIGLSLNVSDGTVARFALDVESARHVAGSIADYLAAYEARTNSQSPNSSGTPSVDVSTQSE